MKLVNQGKYSLNFSLPKTVTQSDGKKKETFDLVIVNRGEAVRVDAKSWAKISDRKSIQKLIQHRELLVAESSEDMPFGEPEPQTVEARMEMEKKRDEDLQELKGMNYKRAVSRIEMCDDASFLKDLAKIDHRKSIKTAIAERLPELKEREETQD